MKSKTSRGDSYFVVEINGIYETITKENRQFILNACNSHEALIEALQVAIFAIEKQWEDGYEAMDWKDIHRNLESALKQAEGK